MRLKEHQERLIVHLKQMREPLDAEYIAKLKRMQEKAKAEYMGYMKRAQREMGIDDDRWQMVMQGHENEVLELIRKELSPAGWHDRNQAAQTTPTILT